MKPCRCADVYQHLCVNLDQKIDSPQCRRIKKHLESCPNCRAYLDSLKTTVSLYRELPGPRMPASAHKRLLVALRSANATHKRKRKTA